MLRLSLVGVDDYKFIWDDLSVYRRLKDGILVNLVIVQICP